MKIPVRSGRFRLVSCGIAAVILVAEAAIAQQPGASPRDLILTQPGSNEFRPTVKFWAQKGERDLVLGQGSDDSQDYSFKSGDSVKLQFETNTDGYAYVAVKGSTGRTRLFLPGEAGDDNKVTARRKFTVPGNQPFYFDKNPGTEQVVLLFSKERLDRYEKLAKDRASTGGARGFDITDEVASLFDGDSAAAGRRDLTLQQDNGSGDSPGGVYVSNTGDPGFTKPMKLKLNLKHTE